MASEDPQPSGAEDAPRNQGPEGRRMPPPPPPPASTTHAGPGGSDEPPVATAPLPYTTMATDALPQHGAPPSPQLGAHMPAPPQSAYAPAPHTQQQAPVVGQMPAPQSAAAPPPQSQPGSQMPPGQPYQPHGPAGGQPGHPGMPPGQPPGAYPGGYAQGGYQQPPQPFVAVVEEIEIVPVDHVSITTGFNYAWMKFRQHMGVLVLTALAYVGILAAVILVVMGLSALAARQQSTALLFLAFLIGIAFAVVYPAMAQANFLRGILSIMRDEPVEFSTFFRFDHVGKILLAWLIIAAVSGVLGFTFVGPVVVNMMTIFAYWLIVDKNYAPWLAIQTSLKLVWNNIATVVVFLLASVIANAVGSLFFGVGVLFALPVTLIAQGWLYKVLIGDKQAL